MVYHPLQQRHDTPEPYPYAIQLQGDNAAVTDVEILNAYNGILSDGAGRHYIARVQGQPLNEQLSKNLGTDYETHVSRSTTVDIMAVMFRSFV